MGRRGRLVVNAVAGLADDMGKGTKQPEQITVDSHLLCYTVLGPVNRTRQIAGYATPLLTA